LLVIAYLSALPSLIEYSVFTFEEEEKDTDAYKRNLVLTNVRVPIEARAYFIYVTLNAIS
jgi:hypothetical protein